MVCSHSRPNDAGPLACWQRRFQLARRVLQSCVTDMDIDVMEMTPQAVGVLDVVLFLGVLYHLRHPLLTLEKVSSVASEMLVLSRWVDLTNVDRPAAAFYPETEPEGDPSNWWRLNHTA